MLRRWVCECFLAVVFVSMIMPTSTQAAVMSIDYGTEWFKVGLIKSGMPLDVALNKDSKRKTQSVVTIRDTMRIYGSDAVSLAGRFPQLTYFNLKSLLGKTYNDQHSEEFRHRFVNTMVLDPVRNMPVFHHNATDKLTVEELIAYQFQTARKQASDTAGEDVKDTVITVTPFASQQERQAILDAAQLAGLNVLSLIHDETAVAINYAINREFEKTPEYHIFYDMGAGSTVASLISFSKVDVKEGKKTRTYPQIEVKSVGFDRTLGGYEFDVRLQDHLAKGFMQQHKGKVTTDITRSDGAMARLLKEATRVKQILSANTETMASLEGLHEGKDFKMKVSRSQLESMSADLLDRVGKPIETVLKAAEMSVENIKSVVLVGGGVRVPAVQKLLEKTVGSQKIAKNVNGDEAAVLGAAFHTASLSNQFRLTNKIKIKDITVFPIQVTYESEKKQQVHTTLYKEFGSIGTRKIITFKRTSDFEFDVAYGKSSQLENYNQEIAHVKITGLNEVVEKYSDSIASAETMPKVRVTIEVSDSGLVSVPEASVLVQVEEGEKATFSDKVKSFFGSKENKVSEEDILEHVDVDGQKNQTATDSVNNQTTSIPAEAAAEAKAKEPVFTKIALGVETIATGPLPMTKEQKLEAAERIRTLDGFDIKRRKLEESRNNLESSVYRLQDFLYDETVAIVSTEEQQEKLRELLSEISDWLYDEGESADTAANIERLDILSKLEKPIVFRRNEYLKRSESIVNLSKSLENSKALIDLIASTPEEGRYHTPEEVEAFTKITDNTRSWMAETLAAQKALSDVDTPVFITSDAAIRQMLLDQNYLRLKTKKKPKAIKKQEVPLEEPKEETPLEEPNHDEL
ncbi:heat shock protein 70 family [Spinellus fusiger]|nr:heat shock protein 70 family [Spinellus fusiger]